MDNDCRLIAFNENKMRVLSEYLSKHSDLRRQARHLENEVDAKLIRLNKLGISDNRFGLSAREYGSSKKAESEPLISSKDGLESLCSEIDVLLARLTEINDQMSTFVSSPQQAAQPSSQQAASNNPAVLHILQRHRDILHDYMQEFRKTQSNMRDRLQREELLGGVQPIDVYKPSGLNNRKSDGFLAEHEHILRSDKMVDEHISIAIATKEHLTSQRSSFKDITKRVHMLTKKYPALNSLMQKIQVKKRRDSLILGGVISFCVILLFLYAIH